MSRSTVKDSMMTFSGHLEVFRCMLFRAIAVVTVIAVAVFVFKDETFTMLLAPGTCDFVTYSLVEDLIRSWNPQFELEPFHVDLIATDLSSQFMTHITTAVYLGLLGASPYILYELFRFVSPALYDSERRVSLPVAVVVYVMFLLGVLMSYFVLFPISFRFLGTYSVDPRVVSTITLDSYISTFVTLTLTMGVVFQLPVIAFMLGRMGMIDASMLRHYRRYAIIMIMLVAAIITPPDLMTLILVALPLCLLYELSIWVLNLCNGRN